MGKLTNEIFNESCCDGGICSIEETSTQNCGCDAGAKHTCDEHKLNPKSTICIHCFELVPHQTHVYV